VTRTALRPLKLTTVPRVSYRAALGVGVVLLALHALTAGTPAKIQQPSVGPEQVRLRLDPNVATREELMLLPRVGPAIADYIIEYRESLAAGSAFRRAEDLESVHRVGPLMVAELRPFLRFPPGRSDDTEAEASLP
jgi:DNA uptake protein ComE-like DNA-binding protein